MIGDITKFYLNYIRSHGMPIDDAFIDMIQRTYYSTALTFVKSYSDDAESNGLIYDRHIGGNKTFSYFRDFIGAAWEQARGHKRRTQIPSWNRVTYSSRYLKGPCRSVEEDNVK